MQGFTRPRPRHGGSTWRALIVVHPPSEADERWALDQALRCEHAAAVAGLAAAARRPHVSPAAVGGRGERRGGAAGAAGGGAAASRRGLTCGGRDAAADARGVPASAGDSAVRLLRVRGGSALPRRR